MSASEPAVVGQHLQGVAATGSTARGALEMVERVPAVHIPYISYARHYKMLSALEPRLECSSGDQEGRCLSCQQAIVGWLPACTTLG